jgi:hypothetical protein
MIIHTPKDGEVLVVPHDYHLNLAGQFSLRWGNDTFDHPDPWFILNYMARNHDLGWQEFDRDPGIDERTGWPYNVVTTPADRVTQIHRQNVQRNYFFHPYAGILSAMHITGFFTSRRGMCSFITINDYLEDHPEHVKPLMAWCEENIEEWKPEVAANPETAYWVEDERLRTNYRLLQTFDMLSLFFCLGVSERVELTNVPVRVGEYRTVTLTPLGDGRVTVDPWPFALPSLRVTLDAKRIAQPIEQPAEAMLISPTIQKEYDLSAAA